MSETPKRRWFSLAFSLRTLFFLVAIVGVWLAWQTAIVRERQSLRRWLTEHGQTVTPASALPTGLRAKLQLDQLSVFRRIMGDEPVYSIILDGWDEFFREEQFRAAFPEANINTFVNFAVVQEVPFVVPPDTPSSASTAP